MEYKIGKEGENLPQAAMRELMHTLAQKGWVIDRRTKTGKEYVRVMELLTEANELLHQHDFFRK